MLDPVALAITFVLLSIGFVLSLTLRNKLNFGKNKTKTSDKLIHNQSSGNGKLQLASATSHTFSTKSILTNAQPLATKQLYQDQNSNELGSPKSPNSKQVHFAENVVLSNYSDSKSGKAKQKTATNGRRQSNKYDNDLLSEYKRLPDEIRELDISLDELDSTVLTGIFNKNVPNNKQQKQTSQQQSANKKVQATRKRHNSDRSHSTYSSERLFAMIAASSLSKDEIEVAVATLLNKLESGESSWQPPKSDPLQKLKNQLRDTESVLTTERHNHEQARSRNAELKSQLQAEKSSKSLLNEELNQLKSELAISRAKLEGVSNEMAEQKALRDRVPEKSGQIISKLEQENAQLRTLLSESKPDEDILRQLRHELQEKTCQLQSYELSNQSFGKKIRDLEANLRATEMQLEQHRTTRQQEDYEASTKIAILESDRRSLEKALKDHMARLKDVSEANKLLEKSLNDMRLVNSKQDELLRRMHDERHINETAMKRTLCEMEAELRHLHEKLSAKTTSANEHLLMEINQCEQKLNDAGQREQNLTAKIRQLRDGLAELFPDLRAEVNESNNQPDDWVRQYLSALKLLACTVDELRKNHHSVGNKEDDKRPVRDKSTGTPTHMTGYNSSRAGTPISSGRSSRASNNEDVNGKRLFETKLVEDLALFCLRCLD